MVLKKQFQTLIQVFMTLFFSNDVQKNEYNTFLSQTQK